MNIVVKQAFMNMLEKCNQNEKQNEMGENVGNLGKLIRKLVCLVPLHA